MSTQNEKENDANIFQFFTSNINKEKIVSFLKNSKEALERLFKYIMNDEHAKSVFTNALKTMATVFFIKQKTKNPDEREVLLQELRKEEKKQAIQSGVKKSVLIASILVVFGVVSYNNKDRIKKIVDVVKHFIGDKKVDEYFKAIGFGIMAFLTNAKNQSTDIYKKFKKFLGGLKVPNQVKHFFNTFNRSGREKNKHKKFTFKNIGWDSNITNEEIDENQQS